MRRQIESYWRQIAAVAPAMPYAALERVAVELLRCRERGGTIFVVGNGGSAATASHFACDLSKGTRCDGLAPFRVIPLTDNMPLITAWGNDTSYERVFAEQLSALVRPGDVLVAISGSGNSPNVLAAVEVARAHGALTIAFTGESGGGLAPMVALAIRVPLPDMELVEDAHSIITHSLCVALRAELRRDATPQDLVVPARLAPALTAWEGE